MIFKPVLITKIYEGIKRQTRRPVKPGEYCVRDDNGQIIEVYDAKGRLKYKVGRDYAIVPGRGKHQVGRYNLLSIRQELATEISEADAVAEGLETREGFLAVWNEFYGQKYPQCWALEIDPIGDIAIS